MITLAVKVCQKVSAQAFTHPKDKDSNYGKVSSYVAEHVSNVVGECSKPS
jgi:hypothetical protein